MWVLTEVIRTRQAAARIGRFDVSSTTLLTELQPGHIGGGASRRGCSWQDGCLECPCRGMVQCRADSCSLSQVDGCYDVNLLSYT